MAQPFIEFKDVSKRFGDLQVLDKVNLRIYSGEITAIIGKSGVGKSVLLKHIIGLIKPDSGQILINGKPLSEFTKTEWRNFKRSLSYMFQSNALFDSLTVFENIALPLKERTRLPNKVIREKVEYRIHQFELQEVQDRYPSQISGGMQKRVALARALVTEPTMILFDEPTTGLDPLRKNAVLNMIAHYQHEIGFTGVMVSHDIPDVFFISNRVAIIENKKIPFQGTPLELEQTDNEVVWQFIHGQEVLQDQLTGLDPRQKVEQLIKELTDKVAKGREPFSVGLFTIDDLDEIKKGVGYIASQRVFQCLAMTLKSYMSSNEYAARIGTGEILAVFPGSGASRVKKLIEDLRRDCSRQELMDPSKYKKVCIDFALKAGVVEVNTRMDMATILAKARENQQVIAKMECKGASNRK
ncbi:MAG: ATP-binding cassette domain-containing protein [Thermodesulfobacteria bacterium]|nr:ATP-binding cassette domain-containing protein [Thermodesulfobacteriota bacterium]